jgi:hypothetical protein
MDDKITHEQIYARLCAVETKVDQIDNNTKALVEGFNAVQGAFKVLGWIAYVAKPIIWIVGVLTALSFLTDYLKGK